MSHNKAIEAAARKLATEDGWEWQVYPTAPQTRKKDRYRACARAAVIAFLQEKRALHEGDGLHQSGQEWCDETIRDLEAK